MKIRDMFGPGLSPLVSGAFFWSASPMPRVFRYRTAGAAAGKIDRMSTCLVYKRAEKAYRRVNAGGKVTKSTTMARLDTIVFALSAVLGTVSPAHAAGIDIDAGKTKAVQACAACHGVDGNGGADPSWPKLAGQEEAYLAKQLKDFKSGERKNPIMAGIAAGLSEQDMRNVAAYYANLQIKPGAATSDELASRGEKIYRGGNAKTGVSACMSCHGPSGHGIPPHFPRVSGQYATYTEKQLLAFKSSGRPSYNDIMTRIAFRMSEAEIKAVSEYMAGLH